jgi:hypothetical protein
MMHICEDIMAYVVEIIYYTINFQISVISSNWAKIFLGTNTGELNIC